jgi:hypothetical protein
MLHEINDMNLSGAVMNERRPGRGHLAFRRPDTLRPWSIGQHEAARLNHAHHHSHPDSQ